MIIYKMTETEMNFAELIWTHEPLKSGELVDIAAKHMNWKNLPLTRYCGNCARTKYL